ncbi:MAG: hypothetical protein EB069_05465, partial [Actinobacteria bacterium]|nr:hypothetical protein [Actinomycetota bacterium]
MASLARSLVDTIVKSSASEATKLAAANDVQAALGLGGDWTIGKVIYTVFGNLASKPANDPVWAGTAKQFANQVAVAKYYTETLKGDATQLAILQSVVARTSDKSDVSSAAALAALALNNEAGRIQDGYISNATVFADADGDGVLDPGEISTTSDGDGNFKLTGAIGNLVATGGTDISTNLPHTTVLKAPAGATIVNPLTTLVSAVAETGVSVAQAQAQVAEKLGLPATVTLTSFDPLQVAGSATSTAAEKAAAVSVYRASALVANVLTQTAAAVAGASTTVKNADAANAAAASIAKLITTARAPIDLSKADTLKAILSESAKSTGSEAAVAKVVDQVSAVMASTNAEVVKVQTTGGDVVAALQSVVRAQVVAQGSASVAIANAVKSGEAGTIAASFSGAALAAELNQASVGTIGRGIDAVVIPSVPSG